MSFRGEGLMKRGLVHHNSVWLNIFVQTEKCCITSYFSLMFLGYILLLKVFLIMLCFNTISLSCHEQVWTFKHTCSWHDKLIVLWILNRQAKIFLRMLCFLNNLFKGKSEVSVKYLKSANQWSEKMNMV